MVGNCGFKTPLFIGLLLCARLWAQHGDKMVSMAAASRALWFSILGNVCHHSAGHVLLFVSWNKEGEEVIRVCLFVLKSLALA